MVINLSSLTLPQSENLKLHILVERNHEGNVIASVLEFPNTQVEAPTTEQAVEELKQLLSTRLEKTEHAFENAIVDFLINNGGYQLGDASNFSRELAFDKATIFHFISLQW